MAFEQRNDQGGVLDHRLEWVIYDTHCEFDTAYQATQQAIEDGVQFIIGPLCSEAAIAAAQPAESAKVLMISPTATHPLVTVDSQRQTRLTIFRASYAYPLQGQAAACFAYEALQANKAALVSYPGDDYARSLLDTFAQQFSALGGEIAFQADYSPGDTGFAETLLAISDSGAEVIYLPATAEVVNRVTGQLNELNLSNVSTSRTRPILLGSDSWEAEALDRMAAAESYFTTHFVLDDQRSQIQAWAATYKSAYAIKPNTLAALGYDAAMMLVEAIEQTGTLDPTIVAKTLEQGTFAGITGQISFDRQHNPIKPVPIVRIEEGQTIFSTAVRVDPLTRNCTLSTTLDNNNAESGAFNDSAK
jgi:branched-chain amino acid transport system substrate-binding protein